MPAKGSRSRCWCFTAYPRMEDGNTIDKLSYLAIVEDFQPLTSKIPDTVYCVYQYEWCPTTERLHIQGYCSFANARTLTGVQKIIDKWAHTHGTHLEKRNGTVTEAVQYCKKIDTQLYAPVEFGDAPDDTNPPILQAWKKFNEVGFTKELFEQFPTYITMYGDKWERIREKIATNHWVQRTEYSKPEVIVLWGPTGSGKTKHATDNGATIFKCTGNAPFTHYRGESTVCLDEYRGQLPIEDLLTLLDGHPTTVRILYLGNKPWIPTKIFITSNLHPKNWYPKLDNDTYQALWRRFTRVTYLEVTPEPLNKNEIANNLPAREVLDFDDLAL